MKKILLLWFVVMLASLGLATGTNSTSSTGSVCHNDYVCTLQEYNAHCPDCLVHNVTYPSVNTTVQQTQASIPGWAWFVIAGIILLLVLIVIIVSVVYLVWRKRGKL